MIREVSGRNGQVVTTWGRDLVGDTWIGKPRPVRTVITCKCGKECTYTGFPSRASTFEEGWVLFQKEWFCSYPCVRKYEPEEAHKVAVSLDADHARTSARYLEMVESLRR